MENNYNDNVSTFYKIFFLGLFSIFVIISCYLFTNNFRDYYKEDIYVMNCIKKQSNNIILTEYNGTYYNIKCTDEQYLNAKENENLNISISEYNLNKANNYIYYNVDEFLIKVLLFVLVWLISSKLTTIYNRFEINDETLHEIIFWQFISNLAYLYCVFIFIYFLWFIL